MQIEELRIGNLIYGVSDRLEIIIELKKNTCITDHYKNSLLSAPHEVEYKYINSIPLTEEILLKCGFVARGIFWFDLHLDDKTKLTLGWHPDGRIDFEMSINKIYFDISHIKYLHQLQNLYFSLTNKELNIEL